MYTLIEWFFYFPGNSVHVYCELKKDRLIIVNNKIGGEAVTKSNNNWDSRPVKPDPVEWTLLFSSLFIIVVLIIWNLFR